jgi:hypothetical protein
MSAFDSYGQFLAACFERMQSWEDVMAGKRNWLIGCGVGCLITIVVLAIGGTLLWRAGKQVVASFEEVGDSQHTLTQHYGGLRDYQPPADGRIDADRLEVFLSVQASLHDVGVELAGHAEVLRGLEGKKRIGPGSVLSGVRSVMGLGRTVAAYMDARNTALLDRGMGFGEYSYLCTVAYYAGSEREFHPLFSVYENEEDDMRPDRLRGHFRAWLSNQRDAAESRGLDERWIEILEDELSRLAASELRIPWRNGLPEPTAESLAPYRARLDDGYVELGAMLCIGADKEGEGFDFEIQ